MPDAYELAFGFNTTNAADAAENADLDPFDNLEEYIAGTDPTDPLDFLFVEIESMSTDENLLSWQSVSNRLYRIDRRTNIIQGLWVPVYSNVPGIGGPFDLIDTNAVPRVYYRLGVELDQP
jgi:hypothetical protein